jgi:hypothetical protein
MTEILGWSFVALVLIASVYVWGAESAECDKAKGVLVRDAWGLPACVPRAGK